MKRLSLRVLATTAFVLSAAPVFAQQTVVWWDFLGGGDGVRMKKLIDDFNKEHDGQIKIDATTLEWGVPFYTKVQTSAAVGQGPDVMTYHESRIPLGVSTGTLTPITEDDLALAGTKPTEYAEIPFQATMVDGQEYSVPFDTHSIVLYYNKTMLKEAGLLGDDGLPKGLDGVDNWDAALAKLTQNGVQGLSAATADGATMWRIFYSLFNQQEGAKFLSDDGTKFLDGDSADKATTALTEMSKWVQNGWLASNVEYPASIALFTSGKAALHINGVWEVPTMVDLEKQGKLFEWGAVQLPTFYDHPATWADSHSFAIPNNGKPQDPDKHKAVMEVIGWMNKHSTFWATAGHIPAYNPARETDEFKNMQPNATYASLLDSAAYDPRSKLAGVASPVYDAAGNYVMPAVNGDLAPDEAVSEMADDLNSQVE